MYLEELSMHLEELLLLLVFFVVYVLVFRAISFDADRIEDEYEEEEEEEEEEWEEEEEEEEEEDSRSDIGLLTLILNPVVKFLSKVFHA